MLLLASVLSFGSYSVDVADAIKKDENGEAILWEFCRGFPLGDMYCLPDNFSKKFNRITSTVLINAKSALWKLKKFCNKKNIFSQKKK